jgi:hypothetical protein
MKLPLANSHYRHAAALHAQKYKAIKLTLAKNIFNAVKRTLINSH